MFTIRAVERSLFLCNQFVVQSLSILLFPNIRGPSTSRKKIGHFRQLFFIEIEKRKSPKYLIQLNVDNKLFLTVFLRIESTIFRPNSVAR